MLQEPQNITTLFVTTIAKESTIPRGQKCTFNFIFLEVVFGLWIQFKFILHFGRIIITLQSIIFIYWIPKVPLICQIIETSKEVAQELLETGSHNIQTRKLGVDMLRQLSLHHDYVVLFVQDGCYLEALCYARNHKVIFVFSTNPSNTYCSAF